DASNSATTCQQTALSVVRILASEGAQPCFKLRLPCFVAYTVKSANLRFSPDFNGREAGSLRVPRPESSWTSKWASMIPRSTQEILPSASSAETAYRSESTGLREASIRVSAG